MNYQDNPRDYALKLTEEGRVSASHLLLCCLNSMSHDDVRWMLDANELSPRFEEAEEETHECYECGEECNDEYKDDNGEIICEDCDIEQMERRAQSKKEMPSRRFEDLSEAEQREQDHMAHQSECLDNLMDD